MTNHILFLGESAPARMLYASLLRNNHYEVSCASDLAEAVAVVRKSQPDIVLAMLADGSPSAMMNSLIERRISTANCSTGCTLLLDPDATPARRLEGLAAGARDVMSAQIDTLLLLARLRGVLRELGGQKEIERRQTAAANFGFAERSASFQTAAHVALVSFDETGRDAFAGLEKSFGNRFQRLSLEQALSAKGDPTPRDVYILDCAHCEARELLSALPDLRARDHSRHSAILAIHREGDWDCAITALTGGASDITDDAALGGEIVHRVKVLMRQKSEADDLRRNTESSLRLAATDPLTGLYNRRYADAYLANVIEGASITGEPFAVMLADIDHFKSINDVHGHAVGDRVLQEVAQRMKDNLRAIDLVARFGGEEFLVVMPGTDAERAGPAANRLRKRVSDVPVELETGEKITVTVSVGVTVGGTPNILASGAAMSKIDTSRGEAVIAARLVGLADGALYSAKAAGRNRIELALTPA